MQALARIHDGMTCKKVLAKLGLDLSRKTGRHDKRCESSRSILQVISYILKKLNRLDYEDIL